MVGKDVKRTNNKTKQLQKMNQQMRDADKRQRHRNEDGSTVIR